MKLSSMIDLIFLNMSAKNLVKIPFFDRKKCLMSTRAK